MINLTYTMQELSDINKQLLLLIINNNNLYFNRLPFEITEFIILINEIWAIDKLKNLLLKFKQKILQKEIKFIHATMIDSVNYMNIMKKKDYRLYINKKFYNKKDLFDTLIKCKCCERHQKNRPTIIKPWKETTIVYKSQPNYECSCFCRHLSRFVCRNCD